MMHPQNRYERRMINEKKKRKTFRGREVLQDQETKDVLVTYRKLGDLQEAYRAENRGDTLSA